MTDKSKDLKWVAVEDQDLAVFPADSVDQGYAGLGAALDHHGPVAHGTVTISHMWTARFVVEQSFIDLDTLFKQFKKWANNPRIGRQEVNHRFEISEVANADGIPLPFGKLKTAADPGSGWQTVPKLWNRTDDDYRTDIQIQDNDRGKYPGRGDMRSTDVQLTEEPYQCLRCGEVFDNYTDMLMHVSFDHDPGGDMIGPEYEIRDNDEFFYPDNEAGRSNGLFYEAAKKKDVNLPGPMPFIYDINADRIRTGEPGNEKVDIGEYNSFGMVEGYYTPDQDLIIATQTSVPYTINHVKKLWEYMYPEYEVKHIYVVHKDDDRNVREKVANVNH